MKQMKSEDRIQADCFQWHWNNFPQHRRKLFHVPNGGNRDKKEGAKFKAMGVVAGVADLIYLFDGKYYCIELKTATGAQSPEQAKFEKAVGSVCYYLVRSLEEFTEVIALIHSQRPVLKKLKIERFLNNNDL